MCLSETAKAIRSQPEAGRVGQEPPPGHVSRRGVLLGAGAAALTVAMPSPARAAGRAPRRSRDLTHVFRAGFPVYTGDPPSRRTVKSFEADGYYAQAWSFAEHSGTHLDAPGHFVPGGRLAPQIAPEELFVPVVVVDIARRAASNPDAQVTVGDLREFERRYGRVPPRALVCMYSGWERRAHDPDAYRNPGPDGTLHFPGFGGAAVAWLLERRQITGIGVDTLSLDVGASTTFEVHKTLLGADRYGLENLANLRRIPRRGAEAIVGVVPWEEGSGGPCRVLARW
jgi:kynurenine formamidase